ncbi:unnamed protein product [Gongylonema pulchrum]|uniref:Mediator of RNA polymerase II transcription subunit 30 n=1 Tax=Gongylonema pulchrum TaxID=637853 RepID=A0A183F098_9BILA|nr:unnamed protein product [Gongylonema pulchrum]
MVFYTIIAAGGESEDEIERIANELEEFFEKAQNVISNCAQIPPGEERQGRVNKLQQQLQEQDKNITFLANNHPDKEKARFH